MKRFLLSLAMLLCILQLASVATAEGHATVCPDCGNTELSWYSVAMPDGKDAHRRYCKPCYVLVGGYTEICTPIEGSATCVSAPRCQVCGFAMSTSLKPDPNAHAWREPTYWWGYAEGTTAEGFTALSCTAIRRCRYSCNTTQEETVIASAALTTPSTCITEGIITYTATFEADWAETQVRSDLIYMPVIPHQDEIIASVVGDCTTPGSETHYCAGCGATAGIPTRAIGHWYGLGEPNQDGTHRAACNFHYRAHHASRHRIGCA